MADESISIEITDKVDASISTKLKGIAGDSRTAYDSVTKLQGALNSLNSGALNTILTNSQSAAAALAQLTLASQKLATEQQKTATAAAQAAAAQTRATTAATQGQTAQANLAAAQTRANTAQTQARQQPPSLPRNSSGRPRKPPMRPLRRIGRRWPHCACSRRRTRPPSLRRTQQTHC